MATKRKGDKGGKSSATATERVSAHEKIARLLGVLATKDFEQVPERVVLLRAVGFEASTQARTDVAPTILLTMTYNMESIKQTQRLQ